MRRWQQRPPICGSMIPAWLSERCVTSNGIYGRAGELYDSWRAFAHERLVEPGSPAEFARVMEMRGYVVDRIPPLERGRIRWGVRPR